MTTKIIFDKNNLQETYIKCGSIEETARFFTVSPQTITRNLDAFGINRIQYKRSRKYGCNDQAFDELNEQSLYWLGMLATDGNVAKNCNKIRLHLALKDRELIEKFKLFLQAENPIYDYFKRKNPASALDIHSEHMYNRLNELGIVPNKTYILKLCDEIKTHPLFRHFIRGAIDGDGSVKFIQREGKSDSVNICLCGASELVLVIFDHLKEKLGLIGGGMHTRILPKSRKNFYNFTFTAQCDVEAIVHYIYRDATVFLNRKKNNADHIEETINSSKFFIGNGARKLRSFRTEMNGDAFFNFLLTDKISSLYYLL